MWKGVAFSKEISKTYVRRLDGKHRIVLPSSERKRLGIKSAVLLEACDDVLVVRPQEVRR